VGNVPGRTLCAGRYLIKRRINGGAMGAIYEAWDTSLEGVCAVKEMICGSATIEEQEIFLTYFKNEARLLSSLRHHRLPRVIDYFSENGLYYFVMDHIEGQNMEEFLAAQKAHCLPEKFVSGMALCVLDVLEYLHGMNPPIVYRDIKPGNIMRRNSDGKIFLIDFGIARRLNVSAKTGTSIGTEGYAPIEQYQGRAEPRSDIYALGATMHHLLSGKAPIPFYFEPIRALNHKVSRKLETVILKALESTVSARFSTALQMAEAIIGEGYTEQNIQWKGATSGKSGKLIDEEQTCELINEGDSRLSRYYDVYVIEECGVFRGIAQRKAGEMIYVEYLDYFGFGQWVHHSKLKLRKEK